MSMIIVIDGEPMGMQRHRYRVNWGRHFVQEYTPAESAEYKKKVAAAYTGRMLEGAIKVEIWSFFKIPKSASKKDKALMEQNILMPTKKPDIDNIQKIVLDGLQGRAYEDDKQIVEVVLVNHLNIVFQ